MIRETIYSALFTKLQGSYGFVTTSRLLRHWNDVAPSEMPAMFMAVGQQQPTQVKNLPPKWELDAKLWIYVRTDGANPGGVINTVLDAVENALKPPVYQQTQTLGGAVSHCWIEGAIETFEGTLGEQEVAIVPIRMLVA